MPRRAKKKNRRLTASVATLVLAAGASRASAQDLYYYYAPPEPEPTAPRLEYIKLDAEATQVDSKSSGYTTDTRYIYIAPTVGIGWDSYLYHPDLLTFSLLAEPGYSWLQTTENGATSEQKTLLLDGTFTATLLQMKPYATILNYSRSHEEYQYDFFNSATVDQESWGASSGYREGPVPVNFSFEHSTGDSSGIAMNTTSEQNTFNLHAQNTRFNEDFTDLSYQFSQYDSSSTFGSGNFGESSTTHYLTLTDVEHFGKNTLNTSVNYNEQDYNGVPSDNLNAMLDFDMQHTANLRSFYDYSFARYTTEGVESIDQLARAGLQHQLYESLSSTIDIHGVLADNNSPGATLDQQSIGTAASVDYSKLLGEWGHLSISDSASYDLTHQSSSGAQLSINNESHTVPATGLFYLSQPLDVSVQSITYYNGVTTVTLVAGAAPAGDYSVITTTDPWQIQIYSTGPNHVNLAGSPVVQVNYTVQPNPSGNYSVLNDQFGVRLRFWHQRAGLYALYNFTDNQADSPGFVLENISELQAGGDVSWDGFRFDANYTDRHSSLYNYQSVALSEDYTLRTSLHATAGIDLRQEWSVYPTTGTNSTPDVTDYSFTARYDWHPVSSFSWHTEAGYEQERGTSLNENLIVARSYLNWFVGKLNFRLGYEFQNQQYPAETLERNYVFLQMQRNF